MVDLFALALFVGVFFILGLIAGVLFVLWVYYAKFRRDLRFFGQFLSSTLASFSAQSGFDSVHLSDEHGTPFRVPVKRLQRCFETELPEWVEQRRPRIRFREDEL